MSVVPPPDIPSNLAAFGRGVRAALTSVFMFVLFGTYIGIGALTHDLGFSLPWAMASTFLIWAAPNQVILVSALGAGAAPLETAIAVSLSGVRLLPMVVSLLPLIRTPATPTRALILPAHFTAVSMWVEALRLLPGLPHGRRIAFCNGLGFGFLMSATAASAMGFYLAGRVPPLLAAALLFLTPISFFLSVAGNSPRVVDRLALASGFVIGPALALGHVELDLLWTGIVGGTLAYAADRLWRARR
jgi:predicted branched-subunit amino acid permease